MKNALSYATIQNKQNKILQIKQIFIQYETDDTWARDCSAISILDDGQTKLLNFTFNGWGGKFDASKDDKMSESIACFYENKMINIDFVLEGGGIESNGEKLLLTTSRCMLNRNKNFDKKTIMYVTCKDEKDEHYNELKQMQNQLITFASKYNLNLIPLPMPQAIYYTCKDEKDEHYNELKQMQNQLITFASKYNLNLIPLPMPQAIYYDNERLPATYANFLMINNFFIVNK